MNFVDVYILEKDVDINKVTLQKNEVADIKYFSIEELISAHNSYDKNFVNHSFFDDLIKYIKKI